MHLFISNRGAENQTLVFSLGMSWGIQPFVNDRLKKKKKKRPPKIGSLNLF